jgi:hypothetical protein
MHSFFNSRGETVLLLLVASHLSFLRVLGSTDNTEEITFLEDEKSEEE